VVVLRRLIRAGPGPKLLAQASWVAKVTGMTPMLCRR
jgi:hypothetical protein